MLAGTGSDVGKSIIATALCRILRQDGYNPTPFKAQNMALNSFVTPDGLEIGRAQAVQAEAAGVECSADMNPLLLKPQSDHTSQVVLNGKPAGNRDAYDYFRREGRDQLRKEVNAAFDRLAAKYNPVVMEGAGSISEINLRGSDLVNMPMAAHAGADVILVGDIDRGGVFASVYGSIALQTAEDRKRIKGIIINKFRGDMRLFDKGVRMMEEICQVPVLGVIPYFHDIHIEEEDSVALATKSMSMEHGKVNIAVVMLRYLSNYTDFNALEQDPRVHLFYTNNVDDINKADVIIIPGSKSTIADLAELRRNGVAKAVINAHRQGKTIIGICGGYQMMGTEVIDPQHIEGETERMPGLALLPVTTIIKGDKTTCRTSARILGMDVTGYEIHMGETTLDTGSNEPLPVFSSHLATITNTRTIGTYLHGILDNRPFVDYVLQPFAGKIAEGAKDFDYRTFKEEQYDRLAEHVRKHLDMEKLYKIMISEQ